MQHLSKDIVAGCENLVRVCANLKSDERVVIVADSETKAMASAIRLFCEETTDNIRFHVIAPFSSHGQEPPEEVSRDMRDCDAIFGLTKMSMAHSQARFKATAAGARYLSLPDYDWQVLASPSLQVDFRELSQVSNRIAQRFSIGEEIRLKTELGTDLSCVIKDRLGNAAPGWCEGPGTLASPPDAETNIAPIEEKSFGKLVVDGSITCPEFGLLTQPMTLWIEAGKVVRIEGDRSGDLESVFASVGVPEARVVAEFGVGLNPMAKLTGSMLEDEGCLGTVHIGIGANSTIGGMNRVPFHLDHIIRKASVSVDNEPIVEDGRVLI